MPAEYTPEPQPIVYAVYDSGEVHPPAHPVPKPIVGRVVEPACDEPFVAAAMFDKEPRDRRICQVCKKKYLEDEA